ncbi:FAD-dependent oxidoreductase [Streptomyces sp. YC504]|uniref:FAD-dependent oxidoreductase n=1 Tax=Streptomyces mesophilus TaxID=1775132 RepID=A0A6G4XMU6_9ACTN|nr:FAD-dependent oxidoreductase [Streptomyces mesophilus]NGO78140.1 FAD-dependent oxidoreductase [Streptomyces mesophilus]
MTRKQRTAVIGSGIAGLTAAYLLREAHDVTLYERDDRLGGHAHTHDVVSGEGRALAVDSGFIVHNERTYPHLLRLFAELGVATRETGMTMSVRCEGCGLEYAGARGPRGLFARPANALSAPYLWMLGEVPRFHRAARRLLADGSEDRRTLGEFLTRHRFSRYFVRHFVTPVVSAVWSCAPATALRYPARYLFAFLDHHGMLTVSGSPTWRTVVGGSRSYVERIGKELGAVHLSAPVRAVRRGRDRAEILTEDGTASTYDSVVIATHPDQALRLLADATSDERRVLGAFRYSRNATLLHTDPAVLPHRAGARAAWNYRMPSCTAGAEQVRVSYDMNLLQGLDAPESYVVTLGDDGRVAEERILARMVYEHPCYTPDSVAAQRRLPGLNGPVTVFAGAYHGWGFHEDGCRSGVEAAAALGVRW